MVALTLALSACGSGPAPETEAAGPAPASASTTTVGDAATTVAPATGSEESAPAPEETANLFPSIDVVRISDGSTFDLATELGGGDLPVLLWFWAPH